MSSRQFYEILGVAADSTEADIRRAFRVRALSVHPDKRPGDADAARNFHELRRAYEVVSNPARRARYDANGDEGEDSERFVSAFNFFREKYPRVTQSALDTFSQTYPGSAAEDEDLCNFFEQHRGNVKSLLESIPLSTPDSVPRLLSRIDELILEGKLQTTSAYKQSLPKLNTEVKKWSKRAAKEAAGAVEALDNLVTAIQTKRAIANENFLADLEARFVSKKSKLAK